MGKHMRFIAPLVAVILIVVFMLNSKINDYRKLSGNFLAAIGLQNTTPSQGASSSTNNDIATTTSTATSTLTLADALQEFQDQIQSLNGRISDLRSEIEIDNLRSVFTRTLKRGDTGDDVGELQELLAKFPEFYASDANVSSTVASGTITGFYGSLTKAAIKQFQSQVGLQETGVFDSGTREKLYESLTALARDSASTEFTPIDIASIVEFSNAGEPQNQISQLASDSTSTQANIADLENQVSQLSSDLSNAKSEIADLRNALANLQPVPPPAALPSSSPTPTPSPAPSAPPSKLSISNIQVTKITQRSATITWMTNVSSTSEVDYSTNSNLPTNQTIIISSSTAVANHAVGLQNLNGGTKYYYRVLSKDVTNTIASSAIQNFTTAN